MTTDTLSICLDLFFKSEFSHSTTMASMLIKISSYIRSNPGVVSAALAGGSLLLLPAYRNYKSWLAIGQGGVPYNVVGWAAQWLLIFIPFNNRTIAPYKDPKIVRLYEPTGQKSFLGGYELPARVEPRPDMAPFIAPQRQERPGSPSEIREV